MTPEHAMPPPRSTTRDRVFAAVALLAIATIPLLPALLAGRYPKTQDATRYDLLTLLFRDALGHGILLPRWLPDLAGGNGYPTFVFYQPLFFYVTSLCSLLPGVLSTMTAYAASSCFSLFGTLGAYRLARSLRIGRGAALAGASMFVLTPYLFVDLYVRGDHSEAAAMLCLPWPIVGLMAVERRVRTRRPIVWPALGSSVAIALVVLAHPAIALVFVPLLGALALARTPSMPSRARWVVALLAIFAIAAALSSANWFSVFDNARWVHLDRAFVHYQPQDSVVAPLRLLSPRWGFDWADQPATATSAPLSAQLGLPHAVLALVGAYVGRRRPWVVATFVAYVGLALSITTLATPFWRWPANPFRSIQFPWRLLAICGVLQLLLIAHALASLRRRAAWIAWTFVVATLAWSHAMFGVDPAPFDFADGSHRHLTWRAAADSVRADRASLAQSGIVFATAREFDPIWSQRTPTPRGDAPIVVSTATLRPQRDDSPHRIDVLLASDRPTVAVIRQLYFPGWHVEVNGRPIADDVLRDGLTEDGLIVVPIGVGTSRLIAYFDGPEFWLARSLVAIAICIGGVIALRRIDRVTSASIPSRETAPAP